MVLPSRTMHEHSLSLWFLAFNNEAEYEALIARLRLAKKMGAEDIQVYNDSQLVVSQFNDDYMAMDLRMKFISSQIISLSKSF